LSLLIAVGGQAATATEAVEAGADDELSPILELALQPWSGDLDQMVERSMVRVVIPVSLATYFLDGATQKGPTYDLVQEFERYLRKTLGKPARDLSVVVIPGRRDRLFDMLVDGRADIAAGIITVTEERAARVEFTPPLRSDVSEVIVTGKDVGAVDSLDELVGVPIHIRPSTSFFGTLADINKARAASGAASLTVVPADEHLRTEDLLEMVGTGIIEATVADSPVADLFAGHFAGLTIQGKVPLVEGRSYAWAHRKGDAKLAAALAGFIETSRKGTLLGNIILKKYTADTEWMNDVSDPQEQEKLAKIADLFRTYAGQYDFDWLMIAAQGYQESRLDQSKRSAVGAVGVMQVMPATAKDPAVGIPDVEQLENNIHAGVKYLHVLRNLYLDDAEMSDLDRTLLSFAAYNAGPGNLLKARKRAVRLGLNPDVWFDNVEIAMGQAVSREPVIYVQNIFKYYTAFKLMAAERAARQAKP
jgi:membrane-bound lytic murein transglycosylase MltF